MNHYPSVSLSELQENPSAVIAQAQGQAITILVQNKPTAYIISVAEYDALTQQSRLGSRLHERFKSFADDDFVPMQRHDFPKSE